MNKLLVNSLVFVTSLLVGGTYAFSTNNPKALNETNNVSLENIEISEFDSFDENNVILSFGAISDTHLDDATSAPTRMLDNTIDYLVELNGGNPLTSLVIGGDLVENTYQEAVGVYTDFNVFANYIQSKLDPNETSLFYTMGNHDIDPTQTKGADCKNVPSNYYKILTANGYEGYFKDDVDKDLYKANPAVVNGNRHAVINGIHFISVSPDYFWMPSESFSEETMTWLKETMDSIVEDENYNNEPIFVVSHSAIADSVRVSTNLNNTYDDMEEFFNNYPQTIYLGGHIHNLITDEYSIEQRGFTMIDLGSTKYSSTTNYLYDSSSSWGSGKYYDNNIGTVNISSGSFVQVDAYGNVKFTRFLVTDDESIKGLVDTPWIIPAPKADKSHLLPYNDQYRINNNEAPVFDENANVFVTQYTKDGNKGIKVAIPAASDDEYVEYYKVTLKTVYGNEILTKNYQTVSYKERVGVPVSPLRIYDFGTLPVGEYVVEVYAADVWHALSKPLYTVVVVE